MTPEEVARLYGGSRAGFELVTYQEVGLPFWELGLDCVILNHKEVPALVEFALRTMEAGLETLEDISGFLGIEEDTVATVLAPLFQGGYIVESDECAGCFQLTESGERLVQKCEFVVSEETVFTLDYDGLTRRLVDLGEVVKYSPSDLKKLGVSALPAFPADPPAADSITVAEVRGMVADALERRQRGPVVGCEVLSIEGLHGKRRTFYVRAVALLFRSLQTSEFQLAFAIDGRLSTSHEEAFSRASGLKKLGVLEALNESATDVARRELDAATLARLHDGPEVAELARVARARRREVAELQDSLDARVTDMGLAGATIEALEDAKEELAKAEARLVDYPVRMLEVFDHPDVLKEALAEAQERLLIVSPWIKSVVVDATFLQALEACVARGATVTIGYGMNRDQPQEGSDQDAIRRLADLAEHHDGFDLVPLGATHSKVLVLDHRYVVVTSFNWLSFRGDPRKPLRDERGVLVSTPSEIDGVYASFVRRIENLRESAEESAM